jgi:hypothetical protein
MACLVRLWDAFSVTWALLILFRPDEINGGELMPGADY